MQFVEMQITKKKNRAGQDKKGMDLISELPDSLIHHILSFLKTKDAVKTCVLSKRWSHLWTCLLTLNFDSGDFKKITSFKNFVLKVLSGRENFNLRSLKFYSKSSDKAFTDRVIGYAVLHSVQELHIANLYCVESPLLPGLSIKIIHLDKCPLMFDDHFPRCVNLETLIIKNATLGEQRVIKISAPRLVMVELNLVPGKVLNDEEMEGYWRLVVSSPTLSTFRYLNNTLLPLTLSMEGCPVLDRIDIFLLNRIYSVRPEFLMNLLKRLILHANLLIVYDLRTKGLEVKTRLENDEMVYGRIYNKANDDEKNEISWRGTKEVFLPVFLGMVFVRCLINDEDFWG